ncbi:telomere repeat-binding protein 3-like [Vicia villosa]|uniref:telomere repeat-binding protein 3-like n=1 Tax=Vicia villosa TaxID=3911 RepID=UPI00273BF48B|nr:telomere repeat-binding protein 3-like [Vicia villosa]
MVFKKRANHGFTGFQVPVIPRAPRSARRRGPLKKTVDDGQVCAFEILASIAGKLLEEGESSASSNASGGNIQGVIVEDRQDEVKPLAMEGIHQGSCTESIFTTEVASQNRDQKPILNAKSNFSLEKGEKANVKTETVESDDKYVNYSNRLVVEAPENFRKSYNRKIKKGFRSDKYGLKDRLELYMSPSLVDSKFDVKYPFHRKPFPTNSFTKDGNDIKLDFRDDDENFIRCTKVSAKSKTFRSPRRMAHRRIKNLLSSKYWNVAPKLKDCELSRSDLEVPLYRKRKTSQGSDKSRCSTIVKRRKFFDRVSGITSDGGFSSESVSNSPEKGNDGHKPNSSAKLQVTEESRVKFSIKSFRIPELYIEVPETATVGSLKRTVMEAVMAIIEGGMHVGVLLQGEAIGDDNRTLEQTGLSCNENLDTLSFMLEPSSIVASPVSCIGDPSSQCDTSEPTRSPETLALDSGITDTIHDSSLPIIPGNIVENNHDSTYSPTDTIVDKITPDSKAIVALPASNEALAVVPLSQKTKRSEFVHRRTRRPFSVTEVEALVHAVEELGTGRWRDVKLRAFDNADHRTYVDLKDKWKTLVHTAKISPQQRRGEPVPQELLDRVLGAHAYWSQHQIKQHGKHQGGTLKITEASAERVSIQV